jgi:hypothetical protein
MTFLLIRWTYFEISPLNKYALALKQNGGIFVVEFRFSETLFV